MTMSASTTYQTKVYEKRSIMKTSVAQLIAFHERPDIFAKLSPPPLIVRVRRDDRKSLTDGDLEFTLWFGFFPIKWWARHEPGPTDTSFADVMVTGPMAYWRHEHIFQEAAGGAELIDRITLAHDKGLRGIFSRLMFDGLPLQFLFFYRHLRTRSIVEKQ